MESRCFGRITRTWSPGPQHPRSGLYLGPQADPRYGSTGTGCHLDRRGMETSQTREAWVTEFLQKGFSFHLLEETLHQVVRQREPKQLHCRWP